MNQALRGEAIQGGKKGLFDLPETDLNQTQKKIIAPELPKVVKQQYSGKKYDAFGQSSFKVLNETKEF